MLKSWSIENFKPIVNSGELKLAPVTVFAGLNSSGKSSLLQSILMISQTLSSRVLDRPLLPNGPIVQLGTFKDILNKFSSSHNMILKFELSYERIYGRQGSIYTHLSSSYEVVLTFGSASGGSASASAIEASKVALEGVSLEFNPEVDPHADLESNEVGHRKVDVDRFKGKFVVKKIPDNEFKRFWESFDTEHSDSASSYPTHIGERPHHLGKFTSYNEVPPKVVPEQFVVFLSHFLPEFLVQEPEMKDEGLLDFSLIVSARDVIDLVDEAVKGITSFFTSKIRYLGPLRADPWATQQRFAPTGELDDVGARGEYAAMVYHANRLASIECYDPFTRRIEQTTLQKALDNWAQYLGVANEVRTEVAGASGVTWKVVLKQGHKPHTLPEVGVGVSQILPILVMGLLAPSDTLLIVEQPELHLHPRVQARLGDFFVGLSKCKKQCLIETHSENLVNQLRYHIVQAGGQDKSDCMIYFVDQDEKGAARFEPVKISPKGNILNWPEGFFDETMEQEDRITAESIKRRANVAKSG